MTRSAALAFTAMIKRQTPSMLGLLVVVLLWLGVIYKDHTDRSAAQQAAQQAEQTYAAMFEENVLRAIGEIDKTILYMRRSLETGNQVKLFEDLSTTKDLLSDIIVQVAVLDAHGIMRATNAGPQPPPPTDLSDRAHFLAHVVDPSDFLYIGKPLVGRASNRMSVQFSRIFHATDGGFGGVVVASLDPYHFASFLDKIDLGSRAAVTLIGEDGVVRADAGQDDGVKLGDSLIGTPIYAALSAGHHSTLDWKDGETQGSRLITVQNVSGQRLWVMVSMSDADIFRDANSALALDASIALALTAMIAGVVGKLQHSGMQRRTAEAEVRRLALHDPLTDLPNRRVLRSELESIANLARRSGGGHSCALLLIDLDRFKIVNDTLGHGAGDALLGEVSSRLAGVIDPDHLLARLGGDEFAVVVRRVKGHAELSALAERLAQTAAEPFDIGQNRVATGVSIGVAVGPEDGDGADDLMVAADLALYAAKAVARGGHVLFSRSMKDGLMQRRQLEVDLRQALKQGGLSLMFQPSISVRSGRIASFEALARWHHPVRGWISPDVFIAIAEETGLINDLGRWALQDACSAATGWPEDVRVAVNISPIQLSQPTFAETVRAILEQARLPARRLEIEITEQTLLDNSDHNRRVLQELKDLGLTIAMDDFGRGFSSLNYLHSFPFDRVKVDRSFVSKLGQGSQHVTLVRAVIDIARSLGMATTAEGVETAEQRDTVASLGCSDIQGYFYARPLPASDVTDLIARWGEAGGPGRPTRAGLRLCEPAPSLGRADVA